MMTMMIKKSGRCREVEYERVNIYIKPKKIMREF